MRTLAIDIETYSGRDLAKCGVYSYIEDSEFEILLFGYAFDDEEVRVVDLKLGERLPSEVMSALSDAAVIKTAFNANFERTCLGSFLKTYMPPEQWRCTQVLALELGLPSNLGEVSKCLKLSMEKMAEGKALIKYFSMPWSSKGVTRRNLPEDNKEKWDTFKSYCKRDVEVERNIRRVLGRFEITEREQELWCLDQRINDRGVKIHRVLVKNALDCHKDYVKALEAEGATLAEAINLKSAAQMKKLILEEEGMEIETLSKDAASSLIASVNSPKVKKALELRLELSKTSIKKYEAMERAIGSEDRIRGLFQFYGANRTGRWAGRLVQVQNLPQNKLKDLDLARSLIMEGEYDTVALLFESVPEVLSQLIRTVFIPKENCRFIAADFSAIEARIIAYIAGESWRIQVFKSHGKIYEASASRMFKVPIESITKESLLRQKGKIAELALGYQGSVGALKAMGALKMGVKEEELSELVRAFRSSNPNIVRLWSQVEKAALTAARDRTVVRVQKGIEFQGSKGMLFIKLPSGRKLSYINPSIEREESFGRLRLTYDGVEQGTWGRLSTYGGKLVENIVQAIARDCLAEAVLRLERSGYKTVMHIHDEVVLEVPYGFGSIEEVQEIMARPIEWANGLELRAEAFEAVYYRK